MPSSRKQPKQIGTLCTKVPDRFKNWQRGEQLPFWPTDVRCAPNEFLRSALFNARNRNQPRRLLKGVVLAMIGSGRITYTGEELRQDDATVWLQLVQIASATPLEEVVEFTPHAFCKAVGWTPTGDAYAHLRKCLTRLQATSLSFYSERTKFGVSLNMIPEFSWQDPDTGRTLARYQVKLAGKLADLFKGNHYTYLAWSQRNQLPEGLATWLHGYLSSHREPFPLKISDIQRAADLTINRPDNLRATIVRALAELVRVGLLDSWEIDRDRVKVVRRFQKG
jgi:hypothetical protein